MKSAVYYISFSLSLTLCLFQFFQVLYGVLALKTVTFRYCSHGTSFDSDWPICFEYLLLFGKRAKLNSVDWFKRFRLYTFVLHLCLVFGDLFCIFLSHLSNRGILWLHQHTHTQKKNKLQWSIYSILLIILSYYYTLHTTCTGYKNKQESKAKKITHKYTEFYEEARQAHEIAKKKRRKKTFSYNTQLCLHIYKYVMWIVYVVKLISYLDSHNTLFLFLFSSSSFSFFFFRFCFPCLFLYIPTTRRVGINYACDE